MNSEKFTALWEIARGHGWELSNSNITDEETQLNVWWVSWPLNSKWTGWAAIYQKVYYPVQNCLVAVPNWFEREMVLLRNHS